LTCALRPSGIFGPRDGQSLPGFLQAIATGKSHIALGNGKNLFDFTYVENIAYAHVLAYVKLNASTAKKIGGQAFNVTNDEPIPFWDFNKRLMQHLLSKNDPRVLSAASRHIPRWLALGLAYVVTWVTMFLNKWITTLPEPLFTPFRVRVTTAHRTFSCLKAKQRLGYAPKFTLDQGLIRSVEWIKTVDQWRPIWDPTWYIKVNSEGKSKSKAE
jgi:sterol-4alpha-carboxylate 3-dehydrogenase (decarboxylating)